MKRSAFTLIELLVVIAIIAVLAGIALPVFQRAQEKARATQDASNLKQLGIGFISHLNDNDELMYASGDQWPTKMHDKYVESWKVFLSPFDTRTSKETSPIPISYGIASGLLGQDMGKVSSVSSAILASTAKGPNGNYSADTWTYFETGDPIVTQPAADPKNGTFTNGSRVNALFLDSHVEPVKWIDFTNIKDSTKKDLMWPSPGASASP